MIAVSYTHLLGGCAAGTQFPDTLKVQNVDSTGNKITVTGREEVKVVPDMAEIEYSIYSSKDTAAACQEQNNKDLSAAIETLKSLGVEEKLSLIHICGIFYPVHSPIGGDQLSGNGGHG